MRKKILSVFIIALLSITFMTGCINIVEPSFFPNSNTVTITLLPVSNGVVTGAGEYVKNSTVTLQATPNLTYQFDGWTKNDVIVSTNATYTFPATENITYGAIFTAIEYENVSYSITAFFSSGGTVEGVDTYPAGTIVTLTALPAIGHTFSHWEIAGITVSTQTSYTFVVEKNLEIMAIFISKQLTLTVFRPENGAILNNYNRLYEYNDYVELTVQPFDNYYVFAWVINGSQVITSDTTYRFHILADTEVSVIIVRTGVIMPL